jgi:hypothetical protein
MEGWTLRIASKALIGAALESWSGALNTVASRLLGDPAIILSVDGYVSGRSSRTSERPG